MEECVSDAGKGVTRTRILRKVAHGSVEEGEEAQV